MIKKASRESTSPWEVLHVRSTGRTLLNGRFLTAALLGSLTVALVSVFAGMPEQISVLGVIVSSVFGLQLAYLEYALERDRHQATLLGALSFLRLCVIDANLTAFDAR